MRVLTAILVGSMAAGTVAAQSYTISTFAGGALPAGISGTSAKLLVNNQLWNVASDPAGNLYFGYENSVLRLDAKTGLLSLVAGNGTQGFSGDGGPAAGAQLNSPTGLALDSAGNLYISDTGNNRVRMVSGGVITTVAGTGARGFGGDGGPATSARLSTPNGLAVDSSGNLYIADTYNERIRLVSGGTITTVAGNGTQGLGGDGGLAVNAQFYYPFGVAIDSKANLYIADTWNARVRKVAGGIVSTFAGTGGPGGSTFGFSGDGGPANQAALNYPYGVAVDSSGDVYIADSFNGRVREVVNGIINTVAGNGTIGYTGDGGPAISAELYDPGSVAVDAAGNLYIADLNAVLTLALRIRKVTGGIISTIAGGGSSVGDNGPAIGGLLSQPASVALDAAGSLYIADSNSNLVRKVSGGVITTVAGNGTAGFSGDGGPATSAQLFTPKGVALDAAGNLYIADANNYRIREVSNGTINTVAGNGGCCTYSGGSGPALDAVLTAPVAVAVDRSGNLYIADGLRVRMVANGIISTVAGNGSFIDSGDGGPALDAGLSLPLGLAVDAAGNLYIADSGARIREVSHGIISTLAGSGSAGFSGDNGPAIGAQLNNPTGVAVDSAGNLYIADNGNNRIRKVAGGTITTIAGGGFTFGDGGPGFNAQLAFPSDVAVDAAGNVYIADYGDNRIRLLSAAAASLTISLTHPGSLTPGEQNAAYTVTIMNAGAGATSGTVTVADTIPAGLTLVSMSGPAGSGWSCSGDSCMRSDVLMPGASYPPITVTVNIAANPPSEVTNKVTVSGGGSVSSSATLTDVFASACSIGLTPASASLPATGTSTPAPCPSAGQPNCGFVPEVPVSFSIALSAGCAGFTATSSNPSVLQIVSAAGSGSSGFVNYTLLNNTHTTGQSYTITVTSGAASATYTVTEAGSGDSQVYREVYALYEQLLGRDPDAQGFAFWTGVGGAGLGQMADSFLTSPEAFNSDFAVIAAYQAALGMPPTYEQYGAAVSGVRAGNQTVGSLFTSLLTPGYSAANLYGNLLGRAPSGAEVTAYNSNGAAATLEGLIGYPALSAPVGAANNEFQSTGTYRADHTNSLYIDLLYNTILSRAPDSGGLGFWAGVADSGGPGILFQGSAGYPTRIQILGPGTPNQGFIGSPEFQGLFAN